MRSSTGTVTNLNAPGASTTTPGAINTSGRVAGIHRCLWRPARLPAKFHRNLHNLQFSNRRRRSFCHHERRGTNCRLYQTTDAVYHGFLRDTNGTFTSFTLPGTQTLVNDINQGGSIIGQYGTNKKPHHGFLRRPDGTTVTLDYPGATLTTSGDCVNQTGTIAGHYQIGTTNTVDHGFIVTGVH